MIDVERKLGFKFKNKPLIVGGHAMEFYGLRKAGRDFDIILHQDDFNRLKKFLGNKAKYVNLYGDKGIMIHNLEIWNRIGYDYDFLKKDAKKADKYLVVSLDKLLVMKALAMHKPKYMNDLKLIVNKITKSIYIVQI